MRESVVANFATTAHLKKYFTGKFWKFMLRALTMTQKQKYLFFFLHTAYIAEVKRSLRLTMYDAPNATEELKQPRKCQPKEKVEAITEALKYFEVI